MRAEFACRHDITNYFDVGEMGIEHALLPEKRTYRGRRCESLAQTPIPVLTEHLEHSTGVSEVRIWRQEWQPAKAWFKVPSAMKFNLTGKPAKWISGKTLFYILSE